MTRYLIELYSRRGILRGKQWYFRIRHSNGNIVAQSEGYQNKGDCSITALNLRAGLGFAKIEDL